MNLSVATIELGLDPPTAGISSTKAPTKWPVLILATTIGFDESSRSIANTEKASIAFGSPKPGINMVSFFIPSTISFEP